MVLVRKFAARTIKFERVMIRSQTILEIKRNDRVYTLLLDPMSPLGETYDVLMEMKQFVMNKMQEIDKKAAQEEHPQEV